MPPGQAARALALTLLCCPPRSCAHCPFCCPLPPASFLQLLALGIIEAKVQAAWAQLAKDSSTEARGIKQLLMDMTAQSSPANFPVISKITDIFIGILKFEWKTTWATFVQEVVQLGKGTAEGVCGASLYVCGAVFHAMQDGRLPRDKPQFLEDLLGVLDLCG